MAIQAVPYALQNASHSAALFRQSASAAFATGGILAVGEMALSQQGTPNMSIVLGAGRAKVVGNSVSPPAGLNFTTQAMYDTLNDAPLTLTVTASNATNPRIDAAWVQVQDSFYSGAANTAVPGVTAGVPAPTPAAPAIPTNAILIGYIAVGANVTTIVTANITQQTSVAILIGQVEVAHSTDVIAAATSIVAGGSLFTRTFPALPYSTVIELLSIGTVTNTPSGSVDLSLTFATTGGTLSVFANATSVPTAHYTAYTAGGILTLPANTAATLTLITNQNQYYAGMLRARRNLN